MRFLLATILVSLAVGPLARGGEAGVGGNWRVNIVEDGQTITLWLLQLETKGGKIGGNVVSLKGVPPSVLEDISVQGDLLKFDVRLKNNVRFSFEGKLLGAGAKKIHGSLARGSNMIPTVLESTVAKNQFELDKETVLRTPYDPRVFALVSDLVKSAKAEKADPKDVQEWVETALRSAENYGPRYYDDVSIKLVESLAAEFPEQAVAVARKLEAGLDPNAPPLKQLRLLSVLATSLKKSGQEAQAVKLEARVDKLEGLAYLDYQKKAIDFPVEKFAGRKGKSSRAVLVELFTGSQCPPCVAADIAFDAVEKSYKSSDVVLLQYHLHIPGPDPLTNPANEDRQEFYGAAVGGTPAILFNGKPMAKGGGGRDDAKDKFMEYQGVLNALLEKETPIKLTAAAVRKGDKIAIQAKVENVEKPGDKVRLRLALVEDWVRYKSPNGLTYHHRVVRNMPLGAKGTVLDKKDGEVTATVDVTDLQSGLSKYLDDFARKEEPFPDSQRPLRLRDLHLVAFVQDDATAEVLQAVDVPVRSE